MPVVRCRSPLIRLLMTRALKSAGYQVIEARNGAEALRVFREEGASVDLLITDMRMPLMDGMSLIAALRKNRQTLKVLRITGYPPNAGSDPNDPVQLKPFSREELLEKIRDVLG